MNYSISPTLICAPCARDRQLPVSETFRTGCWTGLALLPHIYKHSVTHANKPTGSYFLETGLAAFEQRARQFYASNYSYYEEEKPGIYRGWQPLASHSGQLEFCGIPGEISNNLKFVLPHDQNNRHGMLVPRTLLPTGECLHCRTKLPQDGMN